MRVGGSCSQDPSCYLVLQQLRLTEQKVKAHEMAHKAVGGQYAGAVQYSYTVGPDGRLYITGGEVSIDLSEESNPEETIRKMQIVRAAALAPADPSPQDYRVASQATIKEMKAGLELHMQKQEESQSFELKV